MNYGREIDELIASVQSTYEEKTGTQVSPTLTAYVLRAVVLENPKTFTMEKELSKGDVQLLIRMTTDRLCEVDSPSLETIRMQITFDQSFHDKKDELDGLNQHQKGVLEDLMEEIVVVKPRGVASMDSLYRKIISYVVANVRLDDLTNPEAVRETSTGLESVFPHSETKTFASMPPKQRQAQLAELSRIVYGIQLFNLFSERGGAHLENHAQACEQMINGMKEQMASEVAAVSTQISDLVLLVNYTHTYGRNLSIAPLRMQDELTNRRQYERFLEVLSEDIAALADKYDVISGEMNVCLEQLVSMLQGVAAAPAEDVYPQFTNLAQLMTEMKGIHDQLEIRGHVLAELFRFGNSYRSAVTGADLRLARETIGLTNAEATESSSGSSEKVPPLSTKTTGDRPAHVDRNSTGFMTLKFEFKGFCPVTVVERDRLLLKGDYNLGAVSYESKNYLFKDAESLRKFMDRPDWYLQKVVDIAKRNPQLVDLLGLGARFASMGWLPNLTAYEHIQSGSSDAETREAGMQTELHPVEKNIDYKYTWNEWELRRRALKVANLHNKRTHSTQTQQSEFRRETETQVYLPKATGTQTGIDAATNTAKKLSHVSGLRGEPGTKLKMVNLEIDLMQ